MPIPVAYGFVRGSKYKDLTLNYQKSLTLDKITIHPIICSLSAVPSCLTINSGEIAQLSHLIGFMNKDITIKYY